MGLEICVGEYEFGTVEYMCKEMGSYGGYNQWRRSIAKASGFNLDEMTGFGGDTPWYKEPFQLILFHSDCEELYSVNQLYKLLEEVIEIKKLGIDDMDQCNKFIQLIQHAIKLKKPLIFK